MSGKQRVTESNKSKLKITKANKMETVKKNDWEKVFKESSEKKKIKEGEAVSELPDILKKNQFPVQRVAQLDARQLDSEVESLLLQQLEKSLRFFSTSTIQAFKPEYSLVLRAILFRVSIWPYQATYGQKLQNLTYRDESKHSSLLSRFFVSAPFSGGRYVGLSKWKLLAFGILSIGGRYFLERINLFCGEKNWGDEEDSSWKRKFWVALQWIEKITKLIDFFYLILFLYNGRYLSLLENFFQMRLLPAYRSLPRQISFELMNRQLVWQSFTDFLLFLLPLLNFNSIKKIFTKITGSGSLKNLKPGSCPICLSTVNTPFVSETCEHVYCYYCLRSALIDDSKFNCLICGKLVSKIRWHKP